MKLCGMCKAVPVVGFKWYGYDNGQQFKTWVCAKCSQLHTKILKAGV